MATEGVVALAIDRMADGLYVDWPALDGEAHTDAEREELRCLRILDEIAALHRSTEDPLESIEEAATHQDEVRLSAPPSAPPAAPSEMWGRYRLVAKVGEGSFGSVHRAWDPELEWEVAIKILHRRIADDELKERLRREGRALAQVQHPNVVRVLSIESHGDRVGLCMEYVHGESLEAVLSKGTLSAREAVLVGEDVCGALAAVHRAGFVHRDVKARNVMRDRTGRVVLMDFGTGRQADQLRTRGGRDIAGTPVYMAPEVMAGQGASVASDVYSVGVLLYHLVTAEYPVEGMSMDDLRAAHARGQRRPLIDLRPDLPLPFVQVIERALAPDPAQRHPSAGALLEALGTLSSGMHRTSSMEEDIAARPGAGESITALIAPIAVGIVALLFAVGSLGYLSTLVYNKSLGRVSGFQAEPLTDVVVWGQRSLSGPLALLVLASVVVLGGIAPALHIARRWPPFDRLITGARGWDATTIIRFEQIVSVAGSVAIALVLAAYSSVTAAWGQELDTAPRASLDVLASSGPSMFRYRASMVVVAIGCGIACAIRLRLRQPDLVARSSLYACFTVFAVAIILNTLPHRLIRDNVRERVEFGGNRCYVTGSTADRFLLFCPDLPPPRNRIVTQTDPGLKRSMIRENIFKAAEP
ncbi:MAG: serine/threonine-protein kinase [Acidobacteriota bacterium]